VRRRWSRASRVYLASSAALALVVGVVLHAYLSRVAAASGMAGPQVSVVVAGRDIGRGSMLSARDLRVVRVPAAYAPPGSFSRVTEASGRVALADLARGEAVTRTRLARVRAGPVASLIPEGLRAFAVPTSLPPGALQPGDRVDVLATFSTGQPHTEVVVQSIEVLFVLGPSAAGPRGGDRSGGLGLDAAGAEIPSQTTLIVLVSQDQEARLAFARAFADMEVAIAPSESQP
jgi:pilus assembly protein CpaB